MVEMPFPPPAPPRPWPTSTAEVLALQSQRPPFCVPPSFQARPTDIVIATFPKCGTTWTQQIVHGLRTRGSMDFEEISLAVPWMETAFLFGIDIDEPQVAEPRAFKTHMPWDQAAKGARYIYVMREPGDTFVSAYHFMSGWLFEPGSIDLDSFFFDLYLNDNMFGSYWEHVRSWWSQHPREDMLFLCFEDMKRDLEGTVRRIAAFMGLQADEELLAVATRQATFEFMRAHESQFDEHPMVRLLQQVMGLPPESRTTKVRAGRVGESARLSARVRAVLEERWREEIEAPLGIRSYEELRARVNQGR